MALPVGEPVADPPGDDLVQLQQPVADLFPVGEGELLGQVESDGGERRRKLDPRLGMRGRERARRAVYEVDVHAFDRRQPPL